MNDNNNTQELEQDLPSEEDELSDLFTKRKIHKYWIFKKIAMMPTKSTRRQLSTKELRGKLLYRNIYTMPIADQLSKNIISSSSLLS